MARTYLAVADDGDPTRLRALYVASTASMDPASDGHFVNIACTVVSEGHPGIGSALPFSAPALLMWGSGRYRKSDVYLAAVPVAHVEDRSKWWFHTGGAPSTWSPNEHDARAVFAGSVGEISVTWLDTLQVWLALYNGETPILGRVASAPWGPWSEATVLIDTDSVLGQFVHRAHADDGLSDPGRSHEGGGLYGAYVIDRFTSTFATDAVKIYFLLSTWNPYNTVLMSAHLSVR